jgi:formate hydrogenlyase subunit 3/multisubunit Na+/H+ antiporter MnhD subunit
MLACSTVEHVGLIAVGAGIALRAKAMGDPVLAALALQGALLCAVAHALYKPLLFLGAGAVKRATGTASLDWLGGLMRGMPKLGLLMLAGASGLAAVPLGPGFAPEFLLLHAVVAAAGTGGIFARIGFTALLAVLGLGAALGLSAAVRLIGIGFLGRPRTLAAAAAEDARRPELLGMGLLAALCVPVALLPGLVLLGLDPAVRLMVPGAAPLPFGHALLGLAALLAVSAGAAYWLLRRYGVRGTSEVAAWNGGFGRPPVWLPFGDPATQPSATGFAQPVRRALGEAILLRGGDPTDMLLWQPLFRLQLRLTRGAEYIRRATIRQRLAFVFLVLVAFLAALGLEQGG